MRFRRRREAIVLVIVCVVVVSVLPKYNETQAIDPFFTLVARGFNERHMDYLVLIKQYLREIGINLDLIRIDLSDPPNIQEWWGDRNFDLQIMEVPITDYILDMNYSDPFLQFFYTHNGSLNFPWYRTNMDWDEELGTGKNEWYIQNGIEMLLNDSQDKISHCWKWQDYMIEEVLPCLPLFSPEDHSFFDILFFNMKEVRPVIGSQYPCPGYANKTQGLAVRKAISYGINREEIRRVVLGDEYEIIHHPINPALDDWLNPDIYKFCYSKQIAGNYLHLPGYALCGRDFGGWDKWPDWEDVCSQNTPTISVSGLGLEVAVISLSLCSILLVYFIRKKGRK